MGTLNPKQKRFVEKYLVLLNATEAAKAAGYSEKTANEQGARLLANVSIRKALEEMQEQSAERTGITKDFVLVNLKEVVERCMQRAPVMIRQGREMVQLQDEEGRDVWQFDSKGANGALKLLGDHLGLYTKKVEHSGKVGVEGVDDFILGPKNKK
ncbi:MAG: terminase small subunit [Sphingobacteriales bacterium]|nr:MAG: terminase small subunit [Sphingobacteriales bacterium]